jgi:hypothetical protein
MELGKRVLAVNTNLDDPVAVDLNVSGSVYVLDDVQARVPKVRQSSKESRVKCRREDECECHG